MTRWLAAVFLFLTPAALAADTTWLTSLAGVYKSRHFVKILTMSPPDDTERVEDVLEIVKLSSNAAYVRAHLEFDNGHQCNFHQVMKVEGRSLVYREPATIWVFTGTGKPFRPVKTECVLRLKRDHSRLAFEDKDDVCRTSMCGTRGNLRDAAFDFKSRRAIRYMPRLLASREYTEAMRNREAK